VTQSVQAQCKNLILAGIPPAEFDLLSGRLVRIDLELGETLHHHGALIDYVYFPEIGFISSMAVLSDGQPIELGLIGAEGMAGVSVLLGATHATNETMCQTGGGAHRLSVTALKEAVALAPRLGRLLLSYIHVFNVQVCQTAACNAHHEVVQRLARWLLCAQDRSGVPELSLTQDLIAVMLGVRRATVSVAASALQKAGMIRYVHGKITVVDREGLEDVSCECYEAVASEYRRLYGTFPPLPEAVERTTGHPFE
jgi:CRP-like cAMP-binding protein